MKYVLTKNHSNLFDMDLYDIWDEHNWHIMEFDKSIFTRAWCVSTEYIIDHFVAESDDLNEMEGMAAIEALEPSHGKSVSPGVYISEIDYSAYARTLGHS